MFLNVSLKSKGKWQLVVFCFSVIILSGSIFFMFGMINKMKNGEAYKNKIDLNFVEYYTQYDMTVISNKNINTYNVKEWHKEDVMTKMEYLDYTKNVVTITLQNDECSISNSGNVAKLVINNMTNNKNIASLSTFGYLYNLNCDSCKCDKTQHIKDNEIIVAINFKNGCHCGCCKIVEDIGISKLELIFVDGMPKNYTIYDKNKKEYISIVYNTFDKDSKL